MSMKYLAFLEKLGREQLLMMHGPAALTLNDEEVISSLLLMGFEEADRYFKVKYTVTMNYTVLDNNNEATIKIISIE